MILDTEAAVMANFEFLAHTDMDMEEEEGDVEDDTFDANMGPKPNKVMNISLFYFYCIILYTTVYFLQNSNNCIFDIFLFHFYF